MKKTGTVVIANAIIWAAVIFASVMVLQGTEYWGRMIPILGGGAAATLIVVAGSLRRQQGVEPQRYCLGFMLVGTA